jgi:uncharacterized protein
MINRSISQNVREALSDTPVVFLNGARQVGKSTLAKLLAREGFGGSKEVHYATFDSATVAAAAQTDPDGYLGATSGPMVIDEAQRVPDIFRAIKLRVDRDRQPGQFLLTGSADALTLPTVSESLAGRVEVITLEPFSQGELTPRKERFIDHCFGVDFPATSGTADASRDLWTRVVRGGYPEAIERASPERRSRWFDSYLTTILQRDVRNITNIAGLKELPRLLQLLGARTGTLVNYAEISRSAGLPTSTLKRYLSLLEVTFLVREVPAWSSNLSKRLVRSPKMFIADTGLAAHLLGTTTVAEIRDITRGPLLETFVVSELYKQRSWSATRPSIFHYRAANGSEVDILLEDRMGRLVGIEVKASSNISGRDFNGLRSLMSLVPDKFVRGIVLYSGAEIVPFGANLLAVPLSGIWNL